MYWVISGVRLCPLLFSVCNNVYSNFYLANIYFGFPGGSVVKKKKITCQAGDAGLIPGMGRSPGEGNGNLLWYSCLGNPQDREVWWATVHGVTRVWHDLATKQQRLLKLCCFSVVQSSPTLFDPMDCSVPGLSVPHHLPRFAQVHVHGIGDATQPTHPLTPSPPPALNLTLYFHLNSACSVWL